VASAPETFPIVSTASKNFSRRDFDGFDCSGAGADSVCFVSFERDELERDEFEREVLERDAFERSDPEREESGVHGFEERMGIGNELIAPAPGRVATDPLPKMHHSFTRRPCVSNSTDFSARR
jgi:hypothetical protein